MGGCTAKSEASLIFKTDMAIKSTSRGFLPLITAFMVFMACLVFAVSITGSKVADGWKRRVSDNVTIQLLPDPKARNQEAEMEERIRGISEALRSMPGVKSHSVMTVKETRELLAPWLGELVVNDRLGITLPRLITLEASGDVALSPQLLRRELSKYASLVSVRTYEEWSSDFLSALSAAQTLLGLIIFFILGTTGLTIAYATKEGLMANRKVINIMHMVGAEDKYIISQFSAHVTKMAALGGAIGYVLALISLSFIGRVALNMEGDEAEAMTGRAMELRLLLIPLLALFIARATAGYVVKKNLARQI
jgi:cell division transport system permease protein